MVGLVELCNNDYYIYNSIEYKVIDLKLKLILEIIMKFLYILEKESIYLFYVVFKGRRDKEFEN